MQKFNIISQFVKDISFESPNVPELFFKQDNENNQAAVKMDVSINIKASENNVYMVDLVTKVHSKLEKLDKTIFLIESTYSGLVQCEEKDEESLKRILLIDVPTLLFPAVRALVTRLTSESGMSPFNMQFFDFTALYENNQKKQSATPAPANQ